MRLQLPDPRKVLLFFVTLLLASAAWMCSTLPVRGQAPVPEKKLQNTAGRFANLYPNEVVFCWKQGNMDLAKTTAASRMNVAATCPEETTVHIHTHPRALLEHRGLRATFWRLEYFRAQGHDPRGPRDLCYLSNMDVKSLVREGRYDWMVVVVTPSVYCWWSRTQLLSTHPVERYNYPPEGQTSWEEN